MNNIQVLSFPTSPSSFSPQTYTFKHPYPQQFSLSFPIIKYMIKNPQNGKVWKKLIFTCKYFYSKKHVLPIEHFETIYHSKCKADKEILDASNFFPKLWIYGSLYSGISSNISSLIPKFYKFDLRGLHISNQILTFNDYQKLTKSGSIIMLNLYDCTIKHSDGIIVTADKLLENLQQLGIFLLSCTENSLMFQSDTVEKIVHHFNKIQRLFCFTLIGLTENFNFSSFKDYFLKNETVSITLEFNNVSAVYKEMLDNVLKEIKKNPALKAPVIKFN